MLFCILPPFSVAFLIWAKKSASKAPDQRFKVLFFNADHFSLLTSSRLGLFNLLTSSFSQPIVKEINPERNKP